MSNHLGNVLSVVSDRKIVDDPLNFTTFMPDVLSYNDYYPFGMLVPNRCGGSYRYGFNGMEGDTEVKGEGNSYTTEFRQYDPRVGRWLSLDPLMTKYPAMSPFSAFNNSPIYFADPTGLEGEGATDPKTHKIEKGETLSGIAQKYGTTTEVLTKENNISNPDRIYAGGSLNIPSSTNKQQTEVIYTPTIDIPNGGGGVTPGFSTGVASASISGGAGGVSTTVGGYTFYNTHDDWDKGGLITVYGLSGDSSPLSAKPGASGSVQVGVISFDYLQDQSVVRTLENQHSTTTSVSINPLLPGYPGLGYTNIIGDSYSVNTIGPSWSTSIGYSASVSNSKSSAGGVVCKGCAVTFQDSVDVAEKSQNLFILYWKSKNRRKIDSLNFSKGLKRKNEIKL